METITCGRCGQEMEEQPVGLGKVHVCPEGCGVFLSRAHLGTLSEAETDWHNNYSQRTAPMPRITPDMIAPPAVTKRARSWVETLFR